MFPTTSCSVNQENAELPLEEEEEPSTSSPQAGTGQMLPTTSCSVNQENAELPLEEEEEPSTSSTKSPGTAQEKLHGHDANSECGSGIVANFELLNSECGRGSVVNSEGGSGSVVNSEGGSGSVVNSEGGSGSVVNSEGGSGSVVNSEGGSGSIVSSEGGSVVSSEGGSVVSSEGGSVVSSEGGSVVSSEGGSVVSNEGGSVASSEGGSVASSEGGSVVGSEGGSEVNLNEVVEIANSLLSIANNVEMEQEDKNVVSIDSPSEGGSEVNYSEVDYFGRLFSEETANSFANSDCFVVEEGLLLGDGQEEENEFEWKKFIKYLAESSEEGLFPVELQPVEPENELNFDAPLEEEELFETAEVDSEVEDVSKFNLNLLDTEEQQSSTAIKVTLLIINLEKFTNFFELLRTIKKL